MSLANEMVSSARSAECKSGFQSRDDSNLETILLHVQITGSPVLISLACDKQICHTWKKIVEKMSYICVEFIAISDHYYRTYVVVEVKNLITYSIQEDNSYLAHLQRRNLMGQNLTLLRSLTFFYVFNTTC